MTYGQMGLEQQSLLAAILPAVRQPDLNGNAMFDAAEKSGDD